MLEVNVPNISVQKIKEKILKEINYQEKQKINDENKFLMWHHFEEQIKYFQGFIDTAKLRSNNRNSLPNSWNKSPFIFLIKPFSFIFFKILNLLFKDQKEVNFNILQALDESVKINQMLLQEIKNIHKNTQEDFISLKFIDADLKEKYQHLKEKINNLENQ